MTKETTPEAAGPPAASTGQDEALAPTPIEVNRDIVCEIYAARFGRLAGSPAPRFYVTLGIDATRYAQLAGLVGANLKGQVRIHVVDIQAPLPDEDEDQQDARRPIPLRDAAQPPLPVSHLVDDVGLAFKPHGFAPSAADSLRCALCSAGEAHSIHEGQKKAGRRNITNRRGELLLPHPFKGKEDRPTVCTYCEYTVDNELHDPAARELAAPPAPPAELHSNGHTPAALPTYAERVEFWTAPGEAAHGDETMAHELAQDEVNRGLAEPMTEADRLAYNLLAGTREHVVETDAPIPEEELTDEQRQARDALASRSKS